MKLDILTTESLEQAALAIDRDGIPAEHVWSQYYFTVKGKEYPFKYLVYQAMDYLGIERVKFESTDGYRKYMQDTFSLIMTYYPGGYNFFTREELEYYHSIIKLPYRKDNPEHRVYPNKLSSLIAKVNYWGQELATGPYKFKADRMWLSNFESNIKPYIWPRLFKDANEDIFFNVEVNGENRFIGYKLDGYFHTKKSLSPAQIQIMEDFKAEIAWKWIKIDFKDIGNYNWERLIRETKAYITTYDHHHDVLRKRLYKTSLTSYLSWNINGWVYPSGKAGKDKTLQSQTTAGFSYDEWLFDSDKNIDGFQYGYLHAINDGIENYQEKVFDIPLFTIESGSGKTYYVATLKNVEVLTQQQSLEVFDQYKERGWIDLMAADIKELSVVSSVNPSSQDIDPKAFLNIRFNASQLNNLPLELIEVETNSQANITVAVDEPLTVSVEELEEKVNKGFSFDDSGSTEADLKKKGKRKSYTVEREMEFRHNKIQEKLLKHLQKKYPEDTVKRECSAYGGCRIDLVRKTATGFIFYEIKTYNNLLTSIRLGIGQLLEYSLFPLEKQAEKLILVSDQKASPQTENYIRHLKTFLNLDFSYMHYNPDNDQIENEI